MLLWIVPAIIGLGPFIGWGHYVYSPDIFVCEQKWDKQTTFPFLIISFLMPLGVNKIFFLNYKVLKVVGQLQRSVKNFQPDKMQDHQNQQQFVNEDQDTNGSKRNQQQENEQIKGLGMVSTKPPTTNRNEIQCYENSAACYEEADDMLEVICQEDFGGEGGGIENVPKYQSFGLANMLNNRSTASTNYNNSIENNKKTTKKEFSKAKRCLYQEEKQPTRPETVDRYQPNILAKMEVQIHIIEDHVSPYQSQDRTLEGGKGSDRENACEAQTQERNPGAGTSFIPQLSYEICMENAIDCEGDAQRRVENQKQNPGGKGKVNPENEIRTTELAKTETGTPEHKSQFTEHNLPGNNLDPMANHGRWIRQPPGKNPMRLGMLLKEGKAARDVMFIIGVFLLCYLPLWIMALYRSLGKVPSAEAIIATHCVYCSTMVWNPVIYSVRKREFRKALKKLLKL